MYKVKHCSKGYTPSTPLEGRGGEGRGGRSDGGKKGEGNSTPLGIPGSATLRYFRDSTGMFI